MVLISYIKSVGLQLKRNTVQIKNGCNEFDHKVAVSDKIFKITKQWM